MMMSWIHLVDFLQFLTREMAFVTAYLLPCEPIPFWKEILSKKKEFAPGVCVCVLGWGRGRGYFFSFKKRAFTSLKMHQFPQTGRHR